MVAPGPGTPIATPEGLAELSALLAGAPWIALDTEFVRDRTYYPRLCLLQVATPALTACIDPIALPGLHPLLDRLFDPKIVKVLHAARQDLEIFYHLAGSVPRPVFDTQLAAPLLGLPDQIGYAALVDKLLGVHLGKAHTRADWTQRPLPAAWLSYAEDDVRYLAQVYEHMHGRLAALGRLAWLQEDFEALSDSRCYEARPEDAWRRVPQVNRLSNSDRAVLAALADWRERTAQAEDRPRLWLLRDEVLIDLARQRPQTSDELGAVRGLHERVAQRHGERLLQLIRDQRGRTLPADAGSERPQPNAEQEAIADLLGCAVRVRAAEEGLHPSVLAGRRDLERLAIGERDVAPLHGWRGQIVGAELQAVLDGSVRLGINGKRVTLLRGGEADGHRIANSRRQ